MAFDQDEEIEDADLDKEDNSDDTETDKEGDDDAADKTEDKDSKDDKDSEDDEDDKSDSDDEESKPLSPSEQKALRALLKRSTSNRSSAAERVSKKRDLPSAQRSGDRKEAGRLDSLEKTQQQLLRNEEKRQFGYENSLAPDEVDVVFRLTKRPTSKSLNDPVIKGALDGYRTAKRAKANTPGAGGGSRPGRASDRSAKEENLSPAERRDKFADRRREILANRGGGRG